MLTPLLIGTLTLIANMAIQVYSIVTLLKFLHRRLQKEMETSSSPVASGFLFSVLVVLFVGLMFQIAVWALLFRLLGEFGTFAEAFYHSAVNFATLGYGDIVMSQRWRLLGPLEAASGVLMFGLSASALFTVMTLLFRRNPSIPTWPPGENQHSGGAQ